MTCPARRSQPAAADATRRRRAGLSHLNPRAAARRRTVAQPRPRRPLNRRARALVVAALAATVLLAGCDRQEPILADEPFRLVVPDNAALVDEVADDGSSLIKDGERSVLRTFAPRPPAEPVDVVDALVAEGERTGWEVVERSPSSAVARKEVEGRQWMVSVSVEGDRVRQLLAGR